MRNPDWLLERLLFATLRSFYFSQMMQSFTINFFIYLLSFNLITVTFLKAQLSDGDKLFRLQQYYKAIEPYKLAAKEKNDKARASYQIAECYRLINEFKQADLWYEKAIKAGSKESDLLSNQAGVLRALDKFDEASANYREMLEKNPDDERVKWDLETTILGSNWKRNPTKHDVKNMRVFNSSSSDYHIMLYRKNAAFISSSREEATGKRLFGRNGQKYSDIFETNVDSKGKWSKLVVIEGDVNTPQNEGTASVNAAGTAMFYSRCRTKRGDCRIFFVQRQGGIWGESEEISIFDQSIRVAHPFLSADGTKLFFTADEAPGGFGGKDIWYMNKASGDTWEEPINLGPQINTEYDESFPFLHSDGETLYFSSTGHPGMGGLDNFSARGSGTEWTDVQNLQYPLNSGADDFGFITNARKDKGFFVSNRPGGRGNDDIYQWSLPPIEIDLDGTIYDDSTGKPIAFAEVRLFMKDSTYKDTKTDKKGNYSFRLKPDFEYKIQASKFDYIDNDTTMNTLGVEESKKFRADLRLMRVPLDEIVIGDIVYDFDSDQLKPQSLSSLDSLVIFLNKASNLRISLNSHTDSRGSDAYNQDLSQRRAESVVRYLIAQGIDSARLVPAGFGESKLLNRCGNGVKCSDEEHELNRRTTFKVIGTDFRGIIKYRRVTGDLELDEDLVYTNPDWE